MEERALPRSRRLEFQRTASALLFVLIAGIAAHRAFSLANPRPSLGAHGERRFFPWAYRDPGAESALRASEAPLRSGEAVCVVGPPGRDAEWIRVMALYFLPRQAVIGVCPAVVAARRARPTRVELLPEGGARIVRQVPHAPR